ncbi:MAG: response regulator [Chitinophagaceae bacterium]|nr:response regulator [Chitinophagaceae bacterium]
MKNKLQQHPINILLADDDREDRIIFDKALREIPIATNLCIVKDGARLMQLLDANTGPLPDILFLDLSMPYKTGFECLAEIKENEKLKALPVVMLTASFTRGLELENSLKHTLAGMGAQDYIRKTGNFEQLKQVLEQTLLTVMKKAG